MDRDRMMQRGDMQEAQRGTIRNMANWEWALLVAQTWNELHASSRGVAQDESQAGHSDVEESRGAVHEDAPRLDSRWKVAAGVAEGRKVEARHTGSCLQGALDPQITDSSAVGVHERVRHLGQV